MIDNEREALVARVRKRVQGNFGPQSETLMDTTDLLELTAEVERLTVINIKLRNDWIYENACKEQFRKKAERMTDEVIALTAEVKRLNTRAQELSWQGQVDHMSGAFDPNDRHEMGG